MSQERAVLGPVWLLFGQRRAFFCLPSEGARPTRAPLRLKGARPYSPHPLLFALVNATLPPLWQ